MSTAMAWNVRAKYRSPATLVGKDADIDIPVVDQRRATAVESQQCSGRQKISEACGVQDLRDPAKGARRCDRAERGRRWAGGKVMLPERQGRLLGLERRAIVTGLVEGTGQLVMDCPRVLELRGIAANESDRFGAAPGIEQGLCAVCKITRTVLPAAA